jgi:hypothetical protein
VKRLFSAALVVILSAPAPASSARPVTDLQRLARLYEDGRYFELRDALVPLRDDPSADLEFFRGAVEQVFNRLDAAVPRLRRFLAAEAGPGRTLDKEAGVLLADALIRLGRYREAVDVFQNILARFGPVLDDRERANYRDQAELWSALAGVPPQSVEFKADTSIRMTKRCFPVRVDRRDLFFGYDTGANLSVLCQSIADELGLPLYGPEIRVQTVTGQWIKGRITVVPELELGSLVVRNAVFFVLADGLFPSARIGPGVEPRGLIGAPVLVGMREFTETADGRLLVPADPLRRPLENMFFSGFMPVVEAFHRRSRVALCLDTGAATTVLFPPFYRRYRAEIDSRSALRQITLGGLGNSRTVPVRRVDEFAFRAGGKSLALRWVMVQTRETLPDTRYFHGTLGVDVLPQCSRMTLNFVSMSFILE